MKLSQCLDIDEIASLSKFGKVIWPTLKELINAELIFAELIFVDTGLNLKNFGGTNVCGCLNSKQFAPLIFADEQR